MTARLYVVRWPDLSAALVRAEDEEELLGILDEMDNPDGCRWAIYEGPVFFDFQLAATLRIDWTEEENAPRAPIRPLAPERLQVDGAEAIASREIELLRVHPAGESGMYMEKEIARFAFPATAEVYWGGEEHLSVEEVQEALRADAMYYVAWTWRRSQLARSSDPDEQLALAIDASPLWVKYRRQRMAESEAEDAQPDEDQDLGFLDLDSVAAVGVLLGAAHTEWCRDQDPRALRPLLQYALSLLDRCE